MRSTAHGEDKKCIQTLIRNWKQWGHFGDLDIDGRININEY
jgi:hypothetical protein